MKRVPRIFFLCFFAVMCVVACGKKDPGSIGDTCPSNAWDSEGNCMDACESDENCRDGYDECDETTGNCLPQDGEGGDFPQYDGESDDDDMTAGRDDADKTMDGDTEIQGDDVDSGNDNEPVDNDTFVCPEERDCGDVCCEEDEMCHNNDCVAVCDDPGKLCGSELQYCCGSEEICYSGEKCVAAGDSCTHTEECEIDEYCEPILHRCIPRDEGDVCEYRPPVGEFSPEVGCLWTAPQGSTYETYSDVVMTPVVGNLTDDNDDGKTDTNDNPDIVFMSYDYNADGCCTQRGVLRIVDGRCNPDGTMNTIATIDDVWMDNSGGLVLANLHTAAAETDKQSPEIVATFRGGGTIAWERTADDGSSWEIMWQQDLYLSPQQTSAAAQPSVADLDADGAPEVIIGNVVLNGQTGDLVWDGDVTSAAASIDGGVGNNAFLGPASVVADVDRDGIQEVVAGNTVYDGITGAVKWHYEYTSSNSSCGGGLPCDGLAAVGNFDSDPQAEIAMIRLGELYIFEHSMVPKHIFQVPVDDCGNNECGPPTIADFDGDGEPEVGTAGADFYVVFDTECTADPLPEKCEEANVLWKVPNNDCSSRVTSSSVFDFEGDGRAEVVYADEKNFRIFDGTTGAVLFDDDTHQSNTRMEMPVIADVDNDRKAEVLVPCAANNTGYGGLEVWDDRDNNWVRTRRIWNQHSYHITNITEDGSVPMVEEANWLHSRMNNYRQNVQPAGMFDAPDLVVDSISFNECLFPGGATVEAEFSVVVKNQGMIGVGSGVPVFIVLTESGVASEKVVLTQTSILPGNTEELLVTFDLSASDTVFSLAVTADMDDSGGQEYNECDETNNFLEEPGLSCFGDS